MEIFTQAGGEMLSRWGHYLAGVTWIGLLYYFNFVQVPSFAQFDAASRTEAITKLVPRALWWFRFAAVLTVLTGISILAFQENLSGGAYFKTSLGMSIATGILMALIMFANVWMVIWPNQQIVIASAEQVSAGGQPDPAAAGAGRKALLASRTNTMLSIPMLFFMGFTSHLARVYELQPKGGERGLYWLVTVLVLVLVELNGTGRIGGTGPGPTKVYLETHKNTIIAGFVLWAFFILFWEILF
ncbi:MAG TPA: urate hydroxylase PuuD [Acidimicrobiales bacterium]|nr:urate hydroxylase PuuD [Acidimicrobiales bacterium]